MYHHGHTGSKADGAFNPEGTATSFAVLADTGWEEASQAVVWRGDLFLRNTTTVMLIHSVADAVLEQA